MQKKGMSWGWIIFWIIVFWPIGLYFVIRKVAVDKSAIMSGKTGTLSVIGWILIFLGISAFSLVSDESYDFGSLDMFIAIMFIAGGVLLLRKTSRMKKSCCKV